MAGEVTTENNNDIDFGEGTNNAGGGAGNFFQGIFNDPQKRLYAIIGISVVVVIAISIFFFAGKKETNSEENKGKLVPLVQEIDQARAFEIVAKLKSVNIEAKVIPSEKPGEYVVQVYENAIESSYLSLSRTNLLENDDYGLFDVSDWAASDYDKRIKLTRAINGDLSRIISRLEGLRSAIVRVNVPEQKIFTDEEADTTATVQIELLNDGDEITKSQVKSIVNILRGYIPNLKKERISIVDTQGRNYSSFKAEEEGGTDDYIDEVERLNKIIEKRVTKYLDVILGSPEYEVSVSVSLAREKVQQQQTLYSEGAVGSRQANTEQLQANSAGGAGDGGSNSNSGKNYNATNINETMLPSYEQKNITFLPGGIRDVTVALAVDKAVPAMISLQQLRDSVAAVVGPEITAENVKITVVDLHSKDSPAAAAAKATMWQNVSSFFKGGVWSVIMKVLTIVGIIVGLLLVAIISLNFLSAAANKNYNPEIDPNLSNEFDEVLNENYISNDFEDFGEGKALEQQEALLREMMNQNPSKSDFANPYEKPEATSYVQNDSPEAQEQMQFDNLLNDFQSVASSKPDLLAKKIQMWLDE